MCDILNFCGGVPPLLLNDLVICLFAAPLLALGQLIAIFVKVCFANRIAGGNPYNHALFSLFSNEKEYRSFGAWVCLLVEMQNT